MWPFQTRSLYQFFGYQDSLRIPSSNRPYKLRKRCSMYLIAWRMQKIKNASAKAVFSNQSKKIAKPKKHWLQFANFSSVTSLSILSHFSRFVKVLINFAVKAGLALA